MKQFEPHFTTGLNRSGIQLGLPPRTTARGGTPRRCFSPEYRLQVWNRFNIQEVIKNQPFVFATEAVEECVAHFNKYILHTCSISARDGLEKNLTLPSTSRFTSHKPEISHSNLGRRPRE
jgi:hypothetical protein